MKVYVLISISRGILEAVSVFDSVKEAEKDFKKLTGHVWEDYQSWLNGGCVGELEGINPEYNDYYIENVLVITK